jgi:hypothetical protein
VPENLHGLPHPYEVEPDSLRRLDLVQAAVELRLPEGKDMELFNMLGMAMYEDRHDNVWIGYTEPHLSSHDRWLAVAHPPTVLHHPERSWRAVRTESNLENGIFSHVIHHSLLMASFRLDYNYAAGANLERGQRGKAQLPLTRLAVYTNLFNSIEEEQIAGIDGDWDLVELHQLVQHYPDWVAANPEYEGMPQGIVWRMHGLGSTLNL